MTPVKVIKKSPWTKNPKLILFSKKCNGLGKFCQNRYVKTKKNRELGVLTSGIKSDGHKKKIRELRNPEIRSSGN